jgi:hypothetical protein
VFSVGLGPALQWRRLRVGLLPVGGYVRFLEREELEEMAGWQEVGEGRMRRTLDAQPLAVRLLITLSGCAGLWLLAWVLVPGEALRSFMDLPGQVFEGLFSSQERAPALLHAAVQMGRDSSFLFVFGVVAAKLAALNLLPFLGSNGWQALALLLRACGCRAAATQGWLMMQLLLLIGVVAAWGYALLLVVLGR